MSNEKNTAKTRTPYGFELEFPNGPFTVADLRKHKDIPYITLKKRVNNALKDGEIVLSGVKASESRGRPQFLYSKISSNQLVAGAI
jgi:predicted transcriptional regulator